MSKTNEQLLKDYKKSNLTRRAAIIAKSGFKTESKYLKSLTDDMKKAPAVPIAPLPTSDVNVDMLDQVIAFDTTGSMKDYISSVKAHVKELIPKLFAENSSLRLKIVAFGDYCDMIGPNDFGKAYQDSGLLNDPNALIKFVNKAQYTAGGDIDEFYELVIKKIVEETPWREGSKRAILLIADCGPHPVGYSYGNIIKNAQIDWRKEAGKAVGMGIQIDTLNCGNNYAESFYKPLSFMTDGVNLPFSSSSKTQEAVYAVTSVRGSKMSKEAFRSRSLSSDVTSDAELGATYAALSKKLVD